MTTSHPHKDHSNIKAVRGEFIPMHYRTKTLGLKGYVLQKVDKFISASGLNAKEYAELAINKENIKDYSGIAVLKYE